MPRRRKVYGNCVYCGEYDKLTRDHIIPEALFPNECPLPGDIPKVFACAECNNKIKSGDDAYLRDVLVTNMLITANSLTKRIYPKFLRSMNRNQSQMIKDLRDVRLVNSRQIDPGTKLNIFASQTADKRIVQILSRIARGLYNYRTGLIMPETVPITVAGLHDPNYIKHIENVILNKFGSAFSIGDGSVFQCLYAISPVEPIDSCWVPKFYNRNQYLIFTGLLTQPLEELDV